MKPEAQRTAIAEACGLLAPFVSEKEWEETSGSDGTDGFFMVLRDANGKRVPDYLTDLNAMHEAEKRLNNEALTEYGNWLQEITHWYCVGIVPDHRSDLRSLAMLAHATAAQRAEAFLHTLNLWTS